MHLGYVRGVGTNPLVYHTALGESSRCLRGAKDPRCAPDRGELHGLSGMVQMSLLRRFAPAVPAQVCLGADVAAVSGLLLAATPTPSFVTAAAVLFSVGVWLVTSSSVRHYAPLDERSRLDDTIFVGLLVLAVASVLLPMNWALPEHGAIPRPGRFFTFALPMLFLLRISLFAPLRGRTREPERVLVVGTGPLGRLTGEDIGRRERPRQRVHGYLSFAGDPVTERVKPLHLGNTSELELCLRMLSVQEVYIAGNALLQGEAMQAATRVCETFGVPFALPAYSVRLERAQPVDSRHVSDGYLHFTNVKVRPNARVAKRMLDVFGSAAALWILSPLLTVVTLLVKATSPGPAFFRQLRVGQHGRLFHILKFRTMRVNAEGMQTALEDQNEQSGPVFKMRNDPRITPLGRILRKYSIDELPQFINVLRGDMTLVGPRPPVPKEVEQYEPWQRRRLSVVPGLTCIWQVSGRNEIEFRDWMYLDLRYIDNWTLGQDLSLLLKTVPTVVAGRGL
jgi:exopolysaccharide biosynthesis polyprenyl glycosylphosphotransferase